MANEYDYESGGGSGFMMGLLTGTVLGAGLGMLFAPKSGFGAARPAVGVGLPSRPVGERCGREGP